MPSKTASPEHWSNNNLACVNTWAFLRVLKQFKTVFKKAGDLSMNTLAFWLNSASADARRLQAMSLASQLDRMFVLGLRAQYEPGFNRATAVEGMTAILSIGRKKVRHLAEAVDRAYNFVGEKMA